MNSPAVLRIIIKLYPVPSGWSYYYNMFLTKANTWSVTMVGIATAAVGYANN